MKLLIVGALSIAAFSAPLVAGATTFQFNAELNGANEVGTPIRVTPATGVATLSYNDLDTSSIADDQYSFALSVFNLTGNATAFHIHALATTAQNSPVRVALDAAPFINSNSGGTLLVGGNNVAPPASIPAGNGFPEQSFLSALRNGLSYVNVHTAVYPGGEIRGQLTEVSAVPEPGTYAMMLAGLGLLGIAVRRKRKS